MVKKQASRPQTDDRAGDRGDWYLRMLGIESAAGPTSLQEVAATRPATRTEELVAGMWEQTAQLPAPTDDPLAGWAPHELSATAASRRRIRWWVIAVMIFLVTAAGFALWWMPQASEQRAAEHADRMLAALTGLYGDLSPLQQALATATEPASATPDISSLAIDLAGVGDSTGRLLAVSNEPVPSALPLSAEERFEQLEEVRRGLEPLAAEASAIRSDVAEIADFRLMLAAVLNFQELPLTADSATVTAQTAALAKVLAESVAALNAMPLDGPFADLRALVDAETTEFAQWQDDYLTALRDGQVDETSRLVEEIDATRRMLQDELINPLATLRGELDARILELADRLSVAIAAVPR